MMRGGTDGGAAIGITITDADLTKGATEVTIFMFADMKNITAVVLYGVKVVRRNAFHGCHNLARVEMPYLETVEDGGFYKCHSLETIALPALAKLGQRAFCECRRLKTISFPLTADIHPDAFAGDAPTRRAIRFLEPPPAELDAEAEAAALARPNRFPALNKYPRTANFAQRFYSDTDDVCVVLRTWPASTELLTAPLRPWPPTADTHAGTAPGPPTAVVDATGIVSPVTLKTLGGVEFQVNGCWSGGPGADFKALAAAQYPVDLGNTAEWGVQVGYDAEEVTDDVDLLDVALRLAKGELTLAEPWLLHWKDAEEIKANAAAAEQRVAMLGAADDALSDINDAMDEGGG